MSTVLDFSADRCRSTNYRGLSRALFALLGSLLMLSASPVLAQQQIIDPHSCAGDFNGSLSCVSNDIQINDVSQMTEAEGGSPPVASCTEGGTVTLDIKLTTLLNATTRYDPVVWFGKNGNNPRAVAGGTCYASSLPDNPLSTFISDQEGGADSCLDVTSSGTMPVEQYFFDIEVDCVDNVSPDPMGSDPDDVINVPDGELDLFAVITWAQSAGTLQCGDGSVMGENLTAGTNPKCDAALLLGIDVEVIAAASLTIVKNSSGGTGEFDFTSDVPGLSPGFSLDTTGDNTESITVNLSGPDVGPTYNVTELAEPGFQLVSATCDNGDDPSAITLADEDDVTCTFNNAALGSVTIVKNTVGGDGSFDFTSALPGGNFNIMTAANTGMYSEMNVPAGSYTVTETVPAGWDLTGLSCNDGNSTTDIPSATATINVEDGESVTCTFTNTQDGRIEIEKQTLPDGSPQSFTFSGDVGGSLSDGQSAGADVAPGQYSSTETVPAGWDLTSIVCDDGNSTGDTGTGVATFNVEAGETVRCVFTNTQDGSIEVVKSLSATGPAVETFGFTSNFNGMFNLTGNGDTTGAIAVTPGSGYTVTEDDPTADGWANVSATCDDGSVPGTNIDVSPGEAVVCTFTNTPLGSATIVKNTVGGDDTFDFIGDAPFNGVQLTTVMGTASQDFTFQLVAGDYDATESPIPAGWDLTDIQCVEDGDQDSTTSLGTATATYDVELNETVTCTFTNTADGTLIIRKETVPDGAADSFTFTGDVAGSIRDYSTFNEELSVSGQPGNYATAETVPAGWEVTNIACTGQVQSQVDIGQGTSAFEPGDTSVDVDLAAGETVICTFTNTAEGSITIAKSSVGDTGSFNFNRDFGASFPLDTTGDNYEETTFSGLLPGSYMVSETVPSGWDLTNISCSGASSSTVTIGGAGGFDPGDVGVTIDLVDGEAITCTFTNTADGRIEIEKQTLPDGSGQSFTFSGDVGGSLSDGQSAGADVAPGQYTSTETVPAGWDLTSIVCDDGNSSGDTGSGTATFNVEPGETVRCVFTNTQDGRIEIEKQTLPDGSGQSFTFTGDVAGSISDGGSAFADVAPGQYTSTETVPAGWELTSIVCGDNDSSGDVPSATATFNVDPGETVRCVFTNTQDGQIEIEKQTLPDGSGQSFTFSGDVAAALSDGGSAFAGVAPGQYSSTETVPAGWELTSIVCDDNDSSGDVPSATATFNVDPGETVRCVFTNTQDGQIEIEKQTLPDGSGQSFTFSGDVAAALSDGGSASASVAPGQYSSTETEPDGWDLTSIVCDDANSSGDVPSATATFNVEPGETVRCVFTNTQRGSVTVVKEADGGNGEFCFNGSFGDFCLETSGGTAQTTFDDVVPGNYGIFEESSGGWVLQSDNCSDGGDAGNFTLDPGEDLTCTFVNILPVAVPVNNIWALLVLVLTVLATGLYFRPVRVRTF